MSTPEGAVLVGYDGSGDSELALSWGDRLAADRGRPLHVMISEVDPTQILEITGDWHVEKMARLRRDAEDRLKEHARRRPRWRWSRSRRARR